RAPDVYHLPPRGESARTAWCQGPIRRDPLISWVPGSTWKWMTASRVWPAGTRPMRTGTVVPPRWSLTDPSQSYLVPFWMGRMILTLLVPSAPTRMSRRRPPHSPLAWLRVMTEELEMVGLPWAGSCTVKGMLVACWHVSTWVRPCSEDSRIG